MGMKVSNRAGHGLSDSELKAVFSVCDALIGQAGRTTLVLGLRGSRSKKALQFSLDKTSGYGAFAGKPEAEVMAMVDGLIRCGLLKLAYSDGLPLIEYSPEGLMLARRFTAEEWLNILRERMPQIAEGKPLDLPFLHSVMPERNTDTVRELIEEVARIVDASWLPLLRAWHALETRRMREQLQPIIRRLESQ